MPPASFCGATSSSRADDRSAWWEGDPVTLQEILQRLDALGVAAPLAIDAGAPAGPCWVRPNLRRGARHGKRLVLAISLLSAVHTARSSDSSLPSVVSRCGNSWFGTPRSVSANTTAALRIRSAGGPIESPSTRNATPTSSMHTSVAASDSARSSGFLPTKKSGRVTWKRKQLMSLVCRSPAPSQPGEPSLTARRLVQRLPLREQGFRASRAPFSCAGSCSVPRGRRPCASSRARARVCPA